VDEHSCEGTIEQSTDAVYLSAKPVALRYHELARWSAPGWWRTALSTLVIFFGTIVVATVVYGIALVVGEVAGLPHDDTDVPILPPLADTAVALVGIAVALPLALLCVYVLQRRPAGTLSSVVGRLRWGWFGRCLLVAFVAMALLNVASIALEPLFPSSAETDSGAWVGIGPFLGSMVVLVALVPFQAAAEEYAFRGWLLQTVGSLRFLGGRLWPAIAVQAVLFAAVHGWGTVWGFVDLVIWAGFMGWLTVRTGGLEASVALHIMNNLVAMAWAVAFGILDIEETAADMPLHFLAIDIPVVILYVLAVTWLARKRKLPSRTG
jgi:membrane protease YdiL (CAAX protease family)